jgi:hypothetical protein
MNTRTLNFIILVFLTINVFGNDYQINKNFLWKDSLNQSLTCTSAIYFTATADVPFYSDVIVLSYEPSPSFSITSIQKSIIKSTLSKKTISLLTNTVNCKFIVEKAGTKYLLKYWFPLAISSGNGDITKIDKISINISVVPKSSLKSSTVAVSNNQNSLLASGKWYKFEVIKNGIYKISRKDLSNVGISVTKSVSSIT